jgi:hypothetical protein
MQYFILKKIVYMIFLSRFSTILRNFKQQIEFVFNFIKFYIKKLFVQRFYHNIVRILNIKISFLSNFIRF